MSERVLSLPQIKEIYKHYRKIRRYRHIKGVIKMAKIAAAVYDIDCEKAYTAALLHDYAKVMRPEEMIELINCQQIIDEYANYPSFYHAFASMVIARDKYLINDPEILEAIAYHVSGKMDMCLLTKIIVLADYTEYNHKFPGVKETRELFLKGNINAALLAYFINLESRLISKGEHLMPKQKLIMEAIQKEEENVIVD